jgi:PKD repeat protein
LLKIKIILFCILLHYSNEGFSQNFEWLKTYGAKPSGTTIVRGIKSYDNGSSTLLVVDDSPKSDTTTFGKFSFINESNYRACYLVKLDSEGATTQAVFAGRFEAHSMCGDSAGSTYLTGFIYDTAIINKDTFLSKNGTTIFAKFDNNLNPIWAYQTGNNNYMPYLTPQSNSKIIYSGDRIYFVSMSKRSTQIGKKSYSFKGERTYLYGELNSTNGEIIWSNYFYDSTQNSFQLTDIINFNNSLYITGDFSEQVIQFKVIIEKDTLLSPCGFIIKTDLNGNYQSLFQLSNEISLGINCITHDGSNLYFGGYFQDSLNWNNTMIAPEYKTGGPYNRGDKKEIFVASISPNLKHRWFFHPKIVNKNDKLINYITNACSSNGFLYFGGGFASELLFDTKTLYSSGKNSALTPFLFKMDNLGNPLWATSGSKVSSGNVLSINAIGKKSVFIGGSFNGYLQMGIFIDSSLLQTNAFITKITDYDITRGQIKSGPYCAGDTIWVPYTHIGTFDTSNVFIAELSDEFGNFDGGHRELGRLKTNQDSTIAGLLPLFQVSSSLQYRIRVRSTAPAIQSYFLLDTLRLLIYSRDKADPGPALSICYRDTVQLSTFGGTRWTWSPQYLMDDSTLRQPLVWPERDTVYQIIISDSSGCGAPDTAYKTVYVKQRPVLVGDTLYNKCQGKNIRLKLYTRNTDSSGYAIVWYIGNRPFFFNDSLLYVQDASAVYKAVLTDFCSPAKDSMQIKVNYLGPLKLLPLKDTVVCANAALTLFAKGTGGQTADYQFSWYNKQRTFVGSGFPTVNITAADTFKVILRDGCSAFSDSALWVVALADKINNQKDMALPKDTVFCSAFSLGLKIKNTHADDAISWVDLNTSAALGTTDSITVFKPGSIEATVKNSCGITKDTIVIKQLVAPQLKLDSLYDACENINLVLTIGNKQNEEKLLWSTADTTATITITKAGNYWAKAANYCGKDSAGFKVVLYPKPQCDFVANDVCEGERFVFNNLTKGGKTFEWRFGDGTISSDSAPAYQYKITRTSRTYFVTLMARASANCSDSISQPLNVNATADAGFSFSSQGNKVFFTPKTTDANNSYQWHFGDGDSSTQINPTHQYKADSGLYNVCLTITNSANCKSQVCEQVRYSVGIENLNTLGFSIYPNPTNGIVNLQFEQNQGPILVEVYNSLGEKVLTKKQSQGTNCELDLSGMSEGVYWVRVESDFGVGYKKVVRIE